MNELDFDELSQLPLFEGVPESEVGWMLEHSRQETLEEGDFFHKEGEPVEKFYLVLEGELQVTRRFSGKEIVVGTTKGIIGGELALLNGTPSAVSARAILPSRLLVLDQHAFRELFSACPLVSARVFQTAAQRMQGFATYQNQQEKLAALGKLSAGLAHELNNPSAAVRRAAQTLTGALADLQEATFRLCALGLSQAQMDTLVAFQREAIPSAASMKLLLPLEQSEREDEIGGWLDSEGIEDGWDMAPNFVNAGMTVKDLKELVGLLHIDRIRR
jgi:CRP-like cAMP-binding protein